LTSFYQKLAKKQQNRAGFARFQFEKINTK